MIMGPLEFLVWIAAHWWIAAILGVVALGCVAASGLVSVAKIGATALNLVKGAVDFVATPEEQRAGKALFAIAMFCVGATAAYYVTDHRVRAEWAASNAATKAAADRADSKAATNADALDRSQQTAADAADHNNAEGRTAYVADLEKRAAACGPAGVDAVRRLRDVR